MKILKIVLITIALMLVILAFDYGFILLILLLLHQIAFPKNSFIYKLVNYLMQQT